MEGKATGGEGSQGTERNDGMAGRGAEGKERDRREETESGGRRKGLRRGFGSPIFFNKFTPVILHRLLSEMTR